ncbi:MAG: zinc-binding dehydrogenase [Pseudonocardia sp.]|nr:zinc-binding dehydrogenase [Pseudonocardia sp.]
MRLAGAARVVTAGAAAQMLTDMLPVAGRWVLVWGAAGPVGRQLTALLVEAGAVVVGVARGAERVSAVRGLGAQHVVDRTVDTDVVAATTELCSGRGVDIVFDPVGAGVYRGNLEVLARHGCLVSYGELSGSLPAVDLTDLMAKSIFVTKFGGGGPDFGLDDLRTYTTATLDRVARDPTLVAAGPVFPLAEVAAAYDRLAGAGDGKILVSAYDGPDGEFEGAVIDRA